jgi:hypothetical protein
MENKTFIISDESPWKGKTWFEHKMRMIHIPVESWVDLKTYILKTCIQNKVCDKNLKDWRSIISNIDKKL